MSAQRAHTSKAAKKRALKQGLRAGLLVGAFGLILGLAFLFPAQDPINAEIVLSPPEYLKRAPIVLASAAGQKQASQTYLEVPEGTTLSVHIDDPTQAAKLHLTFENNDIPFSKDGSALLASLTFDKATGLAPGTLHLSDNGKSLGKWQLSIQKVAGPTISFSAPPSQSGPTTLRLSFEAEGAAPIKEIRAELSPTSPEIENAKAAVTLTTPEAKAVHQTIFADFSSQPLAGKPVSIRLIAVDDLGHEGVSEATTLTLPQRRFRNPLAKALLEERERLQKKPNTPTRDAVANLMASIARQQSGINNDPVIVMALRSGAVRLVLDSSPEAPQIVAELLWHIAARIEEGNVGIALQKIRNINLSLADALERINNDAEVDTLLAVSHEALSAYLDALIAKAAPLPPELGAKEPLFEAQKTMLGQDDLHARLEVMRLASLRGDRKAVAKDLAEWQDTVENLRVAPNPLSSEQRQALQAIVALRALAQDQFKLRELTAQTQKHEQKKLVGHQRDLIKRLRSILSTLPAQTNVAGTGTEEGAVAMAKAAEQIELGNVKAALQQQAGATLSLRKAVQTLIERVRTVVVAQPERGAE